MLNNNVAIRSSEHVTWHRNLYRWGALIIAFSLPLGLVACQAPDANTPNTGTGCVDSAATDIAQPTAAQLEAAGFDSYPLAVDSDRVDLTAAAFSHSTEVTNPLFPIGELESAVLNGHVGGQAFRTETTLMSQTSIIEWIPGQCVKTLTSQYAAYLDGRIEEVALDHYAQADDGSVWYLGEEVHNYVDGVIAETAGTWLAGKDGPAAMIMPGTPEVGQAFRPENIPGMVFEEVIVKSVDAVVEGPSGEVRDVLIATEVHSDGTLSEKLFAPGYGEFSSAHEGDLEELAIAVPTDSLQAPVPETLTTMRDDSLAAFDAAGDENWGEANAALERVTTAWEAHQKAGGIPPRLVAPTDTALALLAEQVASMSRDQARDAAIEMLQASLDLHLQFQAPVEIDLSRFELWAHRAMADSEAANLGGAVGDVTVLEWIRDRIAHTFSPLDLTRVDLLLQELRTNTSDGDLAAVAATADQLLRVVEDGKAVTN